MCWVKTGADLKMDSFNSCQWRSGWLGGMLGGSGPCQAVRKHLDVMSAQAWAEKLPSTIVIYYFFMWARDSMLVPAFTVHCRGCDKVLLGCVLSLLFAWAKTLSLICSMSMSPRIMWARFGCFTTLSLILSQTFFCFTYSFVLVASYPPFSFCLLLLLTLLLWLGSL